MRTVTNIPGMTGDDVVYVETRSGAVSLARTIATKGGEVRLVLAPMTEAEQIEDVATDYLKGKVRVGRPCARCHTTFATHRVRRIPGVLSADAALGRREMYLCARCFEAPWPTELPQEGEE